MDEYTTICGKKVRALGPRDEASETLRNKQHVFIVGSKGIPAQYGGFETFVEKLVEYQTDRDILLHVARQADDEVRYEYNGAVCFDVKVADIGPAKAIYYDVAALEKCIDYCARMRLKKPPVFYVLACRIGPFIERYKKKIRKIGGVLLVNPDGHEWKRSIKTTAAVMVLDIIYLFIVKESYIISRVFSFVLSSSAVLIIWTFRAVYKKHLRTKKGVKEGDRALIVFTDSHRAEEVVNDLLENTYNNYVIKGVYLLDTVD